MGAMEAAVGWATVTVLEVSGSGGEGGGESGGGKGGGEFITPSSWGLGCNDNEGGEAVAVQMEATVGWEANDESSSSVTPPPPTTAVMSAPTTTTTTMVIPPPQGGKGRGGNGGGSGLGDCDSVGGEWQRWCGQ